MSNSEICFLLIYCYTLLSPQKHRIFSVSVTLSSKIRRFLWVFYFMEIKLQGRLSSRRRDG